VVAGAVTTLALKWLRAAWATDAPARRVTGEHVVVVLSALLLVAGWYYARNVAQYGTPFVMSRRELVLRIVEDSYAQAERSLAEYVLFDPMVFRRPMWPRAAADEAERSPALRDAVWTGLYANTWFDGFGGWVVPRITESEVARRAGQVLLALGILPTLLVLVGVATAVGDLWRRGWDDVLVAMLTTLAPMLAIFVVGTRSVPIAAAVKATYLMPATAAFGVAFAVGAARVLRWRPATWPVLATVLALLTIVGSVVFSHGLLFDERTRHGDFPMIEASEVNQYGVVAYAGGDRDAARAAFARAASEGLHLGHENLALLAYEDGKPEEALHHLKRAMRRQPEESFGRASDRTLYDRQTRAEYWNLIAVFAHALGRMAHAERAAAVAMRLDPTLPEAPYDRAVATLARAFSGPGDAAAEAAAMARARADLARARKLDPGFAEANALAAMLEPGCESALIASARSVPGMRRYPVETGTGAPYAASIGRRRHVTTWPDRLRTARCGV
jgi:tetratricopeptide (TPR) repeat protein